MKPIRVHACLQSASTSRARSAGKVRNLSRSLAVPSAAVAVLAAGALTAAAPASAATTSSPGVTITNTVEPDGTFFYDPSTQIALMVDFTADTFCDPNADGEAPVHVYYESTASGGVLVGKVHGSNVPVALYRTSSPVPDLADTPYTPTGCDAFITPPVGTGTVSWQFSQTATPGTDGNSGWEQETASGTYVDAATGKTCYVTASGSGPWSFSPYHYDTVSDISTHGC